MSTSAIERAVGLLGGQTKTATLIGPPVKQGHVYQWIRRGRPPYEYCAAIEKLVDGQVTCEELCPDVEWIRVNGRVTHYQVRVRPQHQDADPTPSLRHAAPDRRVDEPDRRHAQNDRRDLDRPEIGEAA